MGYRLQYVGGEIDLGQGGFVVGRSSKCDLSLDDPLISRRHLRFDVTRAGVTLTDLSSSNGVFANDQRVTGMQALKHGDRIGVGRQELVLVDEHASEEHRERPTSRPPPLVEHTSHTSNTELLPKPLRELSPRERQVFALIAHGMTHKEAAVRMDISVKTVDTYRRNIANKLNLKSRAEIVTVALEIGVLGGPVPIQST